MGFELTAADYAEYIRRAYKKINENGDYVTELDLATGDGDHWSNLNMGFSKLNEKADELSKLNVSEEMKEIGKTMMSVIGGSSGVLYGSAYLAAAKALKGRETIDLNGLYDMLSAMLEAIVQRGQAKEGFKTMIDSLAPAVKTLKSCIDKGMDEIEICNMVKSAAEEGAENTKNMEAVRGRATYQADKGLGHLDPGAVTMSYQIAVLMDFVKEKIK